MTTTSAMANGRSRGGTDHSTSALEGACRAGRAGSACLRVMLALYKGAGAGCKWSARAAGLLGALTHYPNRAQGRSRLPRRRTSQQMW